MKILVFTTLYPNAIQSNHGIFVEKRLLELIKRHAVEAQVVAPVPWYPRWLARRRNLPAYHLIPESESRTGVEVFHPRYPVIPGVSWRIAPLFIYLWSKRLVTRLHRQHEFELIDAHFAFPDGVAAAMLAKKLHLPCFITARGSDINDSPNFMLPQFFLRRAFRSVDRLIAVSNRLKERIKTLGVEEERVTVLPNGVDTEVFQPIEDKGVADKYGVQGPYILSVGSLRELKGHHLVIEAVAQQEELKTFSFLIAGTGTMRASLQELIDRLGVSDRVKLIGEIPNAELPVLYTKASVFVLASGNEGCPNVVLEALACDTLVVASDVGAVPDLLPESLRPFMIRERNASEIGKQISECLKADIPSSSCRARALNLGWQNTCEILSQQLVSIASKE